MKKIQLIRTIATAAVFAVAGMSAFAQTSAAPTGWSSNMVFPTSTNAVDTVTKGSIMPYRVTGDINMHKLRAQGALKNSQFTKGVTANGIITGSPALTDSVFTVQWNTTGSTDTVYVTEVPVAFDGTALTCSVNTEKLPIVIVDRPTIAWTTTTLQVGCGLDKPLIPVQIPINVTGIGQWKVYYQIDYTDMSGTTTLKKADYTSTPVTIGSWKSGPQTLNLSYAIATGAYGTYTVTITGISDRISEKSGVASVAGDFPAATSTYKIIALPAPTTGKIQHIKNL